MVILTKTKMSVQLYAFLLMISALFSATADAMNSTEDIKHAVRVLKGIDSDITKEKAVSVLREAAENDSVPYAMNSLGLVYMAGLGAPQDTAQAVRWLEAAGANGFAEAYHNLGMMYKNAQCGTSQDFRKAFRHYKQGADAGSVMCMYDAGYMLYKGLGCQQDYAKAAELFQQGADKDHSPCLYMLGLCYRNGYGVGLDDERAAFFLNRAATLGYSPAIEEVRRPDAENYLHEELLANDTYGDVPARMPDILSDVNDVTMLSGRYQGFIVMYDWSGRYILGEKPVTLSMSRDGKVVSGLLMLATDSVPFRATVSADGRLSFSDGGVELNERYTVGSKVPYRMDSAELDVWQDRIAGRLSLYSLKLMEPERPMYIELQKRPSPALPVREGDDADRYTRVVASPNPFSSQFDVSFELPEPCDAKLRLYDVYGKLAYTQDLGRIEEGRHTETIMPNVLDGTYVLNVTVGSRVLRTIIVKKGGAR